MPGRWNPYAVEDITSAEKQAVQERAQMRQKLKADWQKKVNNPHRGVGGSIFDPTVQRFISMRAQHWEQFRANPRTSWFGFWFAALPIMSITYYVYKTKNDLDTKCRNGEIAYRDRRWKHV